MAEEAGGVPPALIEAGFLTVDGEPAVPFGTLAKLVVSLQRQVDELDEMLKWNERMVSQQGSRIRRLLRDEDQRLKHHPLYPDAREVLEFWKKHVMPSAKELEGNSRLKNVIDRLKERDGYSKDQLIRAALGYKLKPYMVRGRRVAHGSKEDWKADAELIYREPRFVDQGLRIVEQDEMYEAALAAPAGAAAVNVPVNGTRPVQNGSGPQTVSEKAVWYAEGLGWMVFPCRPGRKEPATPNGLLDAHTDAVRIRRYWDAHPTANIAVRTGQESSVVVVDVDGEDGAASLRELEQKHSSFPRTLSVVTPRGGEHYYFQHPGQEIRNSVSMIAAGIDIRGDGGYALIPPSCVGERCYEFDERTKPAPLPVWLLRLMLEYQVKQREGMDYAAFVRDGTKEGARDTNLTRLTGHLYSKGMEPSEVYELVKSVNDARCNPPLEASQIRKIVDSIDRRRQRQALRDLEGVAA